MTYSSLWSENFDDTAFKEGLREWLTTGVVRHDRSHVRDFALVKLPAEDERTGRDFGRLLRERKAILGVFDEGCMGMFISQLRDKHGISSALAD